MPRKSLVLLLSLFIMMGARARAQDEIPAPPTASDQESTDVATPDQMGDADPLDVIEDQKQSPAPAEPAVPQFTDIPAPGENTEAPAESGPVAPVTPPAPELAPPAENFAATGEESGDTPDLQKEQRFHEIYKKYNEQPTSVEAWDKVVGARSSQNYQVQKGDTLWDLSNTLFGDPHYWPKVWSLNVDHIGNPHEIDPQMVIQFYPGTMEDAPTVNLASAEQAAAAQSDGKGESEASPAPVAKAKRIPPVLKSLPPSIPLYRYGGVLTPPVSVDVLPRRNRSFVAPEDLTYYISKEAPQGAGRVTETEMGMDTATDYQYVIVHLDGDGGGKSFHAVKLVDKLTDLQNKDRKTNLIEVQGEIEILEKVNDEKNLYRAIVKKTVEPIDVGALLLPGPLPTFDPSPTPVVSGPSALIIGGQYQAGRQQFQNRSLVFLDAGSEQGLQEGQSLSIFSDIRRRNKDTQAVMNDRRIGTVKIVRVGDHFATAYITRADDDVFVGDHVGSATVTASAAGTGAALGGEESTPKASDSSGDDLNLEDDSSGAAPAPAESPAPADDDFSL